MISALTGIQIGPRQLELPPNMGVLALAIIPQRGHAAFANGVPAGDYWQAFPYGDSEGIALPGVQAENLTTVVAHAFGISTKARGVVITSIDPQSVAAAAGVERGDIIQAVNNIPVANVQEYDQALVGAHEQSILLLIRRGTTTHSVALQSD